MGNYATQFGIIILEETDASIFKTWPENGGNKFL
jgi:hypothetical protein